MPNPNTYECKQCGATFDSKEQLDGHNRREHSSGSTAEAGAGAGSSRGTGGTGNKESGWSGGNPSQKKNM